MTPDNGSPLLIGHGRAVLTRSQTEDWVVRSQMFSQFLVVHWRFDEPIIDGYSYGFSGKLGVEAAWRMARRVYATPPVEFHQDAELCEKIPGELLVWRGTMSGRTVTVEHFLTVD